MANLEELVVSLVAETSGLRSELQKATNATKDASSKMDDAIKSFTDNSSKNMGFFQTALSTMTGFLAAEAVQAVISFAKDGLELMTEQLIEGGKAAIAEENALKRLATSLALSGQYSQEAMVSLQAFTGEMEDLTGISDDVVASNLAVLSSLTKLDTEGLKRAQKAALDMSVALGVDLDTATNLVAKGIEGNVTAFKRYGIEIEEGTTKAARLSNILSKLEGSFGGAASEAAKTFGGALTNLNNAWGNFTESLATAVTKNPVVIEMMNTITNIMRELTGQSNNASVAIQQGLGNALIALAEIIAYTAAGVDLFVTIFKAGLQSIVLGLNAVAGGIAFVGDALGLIKDDDPFQRLNETSNALVDTLTDQSSLSLFSEKMLEIRDAGVLAFTDIKSAGEAVTTSVQNQTEAISETEAAYQKLVNAFAASLAEQGTALDNQFAYETEARALHLQNEIAMLQEHDATKTAMREENFAIQEEALLAQQAREWEQLAASNLAKKGNEEQYNAARTALEQKHHLEFLKQEKSRTDFEVEQQRQREANMRSTLNYIATLQQSSSKELAAIGKAAAITTATIDGIVAVQKALSAFPPPFNFVAAALVGVAAAANVAKIAGVNLNSGGTLAGGGANADTVPANLTKGETVVTRGLTDKMEEFFSDPSRAGGGGHVTVTLELKDNLVEFIEAKILERQATNVSLLGSGVV